MAVSLLVCLNVQGGFTYNPDKVNIWRYRDQEPKEPKQMQKIQAALQISLAQEIKRTTVNTGSAADTVSKCSAHSRYRKLSKYI
jgi:hypothetical protein